MATVKLPGLVDVHVHLREPGNTHKEDFETGTKAAIAGGYTTVFDMPNNPNSIVTPKTLSEKIKLAKGRIYCNVGFHFGGSKMAVPYFGKVRDKVWGLKVYMNHTTGNLLIENDSELNLIFSKWLKKKVLMVHAEGDTLAKAIKLAKKHRNRLHVCHLSLADEIDQVKKARKAGMDITCEVSCHHLFLNNSDAKRLGAFGFMKPNLSSKKDVEYIWKNLDVVDMIASDHAPHTLEEKKTSEKPPFGVPGLETSLPLMLNAVNEGRLSLERMVELMSTNPRKLFGLPDIILANSVRPGPMSQDSSDSDLEKHRRSSKAHDSGGAKASQNDKQTYVEVDMIQKWTIKNKNIISKSGWTPFDGMKIKGKIKKVVLRGKVVFDGEKVLGPFGKIIYP